MTAPHHPPDLQGIASLFDALQKIQDRFDCFEQRNTAANEVMPLLVEGWDFTSDPRKVDEPGEGMWRAPHLAIVKGTDLLGAGICAIISPGMSLAKLQAGLWRQSRVLPKNEPWRRLAVDRPAHADPFEPDARQPAGDAETELLIQIAAVDVGDRSRDDFFVTLIGHTVKDVCEFLVEVEKSDPELAKLLFAKNFMETRATSFASLALPWPASCISRFKREKRRDHLPPVLALILLAETARHAQVQALHTRLSFDKDGYRIGLKIVCEDIVTVAGGHALAATKLLLRCKWLQSSALLAPTATMGSADADAALAWTDKSQREIFAFAYHAGNEGTDAIDGALRSVFAPALGKEVAGAECDFRSHPNVWLSRADGTASFPNRLAVTFHGMTWSENASVALTLIADQARSWSKHYRPHGRIPERRRDGRPSLAQSIAAIMYCWLETSAPEAFFGTYGRAARPDASDVCEPEDMSAEDLIVGADSGKNLLEEARNIISLLPRAGEKGSSSFARASLWFERQHDDLVHYRAMARLSLRSIVEIKGFHDERARHGSIPASVVGSASFRRRGKAGLTGQQSGSGLNSRPSKAATERDGKIAARVAQAEAMLLLPTSTDPMRAYLLRGARTRLDGNRPSTSKPSRVSVKTTPNV